MVNTAKFRRVAIGSAQTPLPMWDSKANAMGALAQETGRIIFYTSNSDKSRKGAAKPADREDIITAQDRIYGDLMRYLPTRSMLPFLKHELVERDPHHIDWDKHSYLAGYLGAPSIGKSFMIKMLGKLAHPRGCLYLDCKDADMGVIFCETVFDTSSANKEKAAIDARILQGNANPEMPLKLESVNMLRDILGDAFIEENRGANMVLSIDWNGIKVKGETPEEQGHYKQVLRQAIKQVCENENIEISNGINNIGITTRDGIAIRAADPNSPDYGRPILLDEMNTAKRGTMQKLYEYFAMLSDPSVPSFEVMGGENKPFTFHRKDLPVTYRVNFTGNPKSKGLEDRQDFDRALNSRLGRELDIITVPDPELRDFVDRIAQSLCGVPVAQVYFSAEKEFTADQGMFLDALRYYRFHGRTNTEIKSVPEDEILNINNAVNILTLSGQLAELFHGLKGMLSPESSSHQDMNLDLATEYTEYLSGIEIDLRLVSKLMEKASVISPEFMKWDKVSYRGIFGGTANAEPPIVSLEEKVGNRGDRLEAYLLQWIQRVIYPVDAATRNIKQEDCDKLMKQVQRLAANCGLGDLKFRDPKNSTSKPIKELFNLNLMKDPGYQAKKLRDLLIEQLRAENPDLLISSNPDEIISLAALERAKAMHVAAKRPESLPLNITAFTVPNNDPDSFTQSPFAHVLAADSIPVDDKILMLETQTEMLTARDAFLPMLGLPALKDTTISSLWNPALAAHTEQADESAKMASHTSDSGIGVTTVMTRHQNRPEHIHVIHNKVNNRTVLVGGPIELKIRALLSANGMTYIDLTTANAAEMVNESILNLIGIKEIGCIETIKGAFFVRNGSIDFSNDPESWKLSLGELMTQPERIPPVMPIYLTKARTLGELGHLSKQLDRNGSGIKVGGIQ